MIRLIDFIISFLGVVLLIPILFVISLLIKVTSEGPIFYKQNRVGLKGKLFLIWKFRTMYINSESIGLPITIGDRDPRVTHFGFLLRKFKLDELPQLFNVLKGEMSLVGPRPEVEKYVMYYSDKQRKVLDVKPGITDMASIVFKNENEILSKFNQPEDIYIKEIMPQKIELNMSYINNRNVFLYFKIIVLTLKAIFFKNNSYIKL